MRNAPRAPWECVGSSLTYLAVVLASLALVASLPACQSANLPALQKHLVLAMCNDQVASKVSKEAKAA